MSFQSASMLAGCALAGTVLAAVALAAPPTGETHIENMPAAPHASANVSVNFTGTPNDPDAGGDGIDPSMDPPEAMGDPINCGCAAEFVQGQVVEALVDIPAPVQTILAGSTGTVQCGEDNKIFGGQFVFVSWDDWNYGNNGNNNCECPVGNPIIDNSGWWVECVKIAPVPCPADINNDTIVGIVDLLALLANWGPCPEPCTPGTPNEPDDCPEDINRDCVVGIVDLLALLSAWGSCGS